MMGTASRLMSVNLPLDQMTAKEKLEAMEALWTDLTRNQKEFKSPAWHEKVLRERDDRVRAGQESFIDWEATKKQLREDCLRSPT
jgi:Putative addiction module component